MATTSRDPAEIHFLKDLEVRDLDTLDLASLAHAVHLGVHLASLPFRMAVFGPWGSGKTTVMRRVQAVLDEATVAGRLPRFGPEADAPPAVDEPSGPEENAPFVSTLWFNPWEHESDTSLVRSLVEAIADLIPDGVRYSRKGLRVVHHALESVRHLGHRVGAAYATRTQVDSGAALLPSEEVVEADRLVTLRQSLRRLVDLVLSPAKRGQPRRLVVFIDDLDKCIPDSVLTFLEACKLFFTDDARIVFVFALDREVLANAIRLKYSRGGGFDPEHYVEKIFEFTYTVHPIQWHQLGTLVGDLYARSAIGALHDGDTTAAQLAIIEQVLQRPGVVLNPRKIKRIFNKFIWLLASRAWLPHGNEYSLELWLSWVLVTEYWREFRHYVGRFGGEVIGELCNRVTGNLLFPHANEMVRQSLETLPGYRSLIDYFRHYFNAVGDMHTPEAQSRLKAMIDQLIVIDKTLRTHGL